ncbi:LacI family transcriptional regulator [Puniceicoccales bacterium CK1056]|uniref:LacI family transcriptional regulator n=1 Tax=Oceanipulchritudo coccoides TaxID=2706888 RepID=A0A6B2LYT9_9BACT|nr:LacI family DNA-binding transcriptional regulator [Oceanipulchritudo coccoides]NDV61583.1 LacI family transcriptional regulator [Oceanipulchritudo coccoides]
MSKQPIKRITSIKEIAQLAGCSIATVSNTLNNKGRISQEVREKVLEICEKHGYVPNSAGRNLRRQTMETVGLLFYPSTSAIFRNIFYAEIMEALEATMESRGYDLLLSGFDSSVADQHTPRFIRQGKVDGIILLGGFPRSEVRKLLGFSLPLLHLDSYRERIKIDYITTDGYAACGQIVDHLVNLGHRRIVFMAHAHEDTNADQREAGFLAAVNRHDLPKTLNPSMRDFYRTDDGYERLKPLLLGKRPPTAVICVNDTLAVELLEKLKDDGFSIPRDLTIFGYNDDRHSRSSSPPISTVKVDKAGLGRIGAETIINRIQNPETSVSSVLLPVELVHRGSEAPPKA